MTRTDHLLACLAEECAEVAQRATKAMRFGLKEIQPGQPHTNAERLAKEINDLIAVVGMLACAKAIPEDLIFQENAADVKVTKVSLFLEYSRQCGTYSPDPEPGDSV